MEEEWFKEYQKLGGKSSEEDYLFYLKVFLAITVGYVGESPISREESYYKWVEFIESEKEAELYFRSVDNVTAYT
jgi:hypothetical protein